MKRILVVLLAAILLLGAFGCRTETEKPAPAAEATEQPTETPSPTEAITEAPTQKPTEAPTPAPTPTPEPTPEPPKTAADLWAELDKAYPALHAAVSKRALRMNIWDPAAFGIDESALPENCFGSEEEYQQYYDTMRALLSRVAEIDRFALDEKDQFAFNTVTESLKADLKNREYILYEDPFGEGIGWQLMLLQDFANFRIGSVNDIEAYLSAISYIPTFLDKLIVREQTRVENGLFMPESALNGVLEEIGRVRDAGDSFFGYAYLGTCMDALGMSSAEQAPYLARNQAAVDAVIAAYGKLYDALDGLREHCEDPLTPYSNVPSVENSAWYRSFCAKLAGIAGVQEQHTAIDVYMIYDVVLSLLSRDFSSVDFPEEGDEAYEPALPEQVFADTMQRLQEEYWPLSAPKPAVRYLPELDEPDFGAVKFKLYYDVPEQSVLYFNPKVDDAALATRYVACNNYFLRYHLEREDLSRAQILSAPDTYYAGLGFYADLTLLRDLAEKTGSSAYYEEYYTQFMILYDYTLTAYTACLIAAGYDADDIKKDLTDYYQVPEDVAESIYDQARSDPMSAIELTYGFARLYLLHEACRIKLRGRMNDRQFLKTYLSFGPSFPDMLEDKMVAWCESMLNFSDT